jgi:hypothetical protein
VIERNHGVGSDSRHELDKADGNGHGHSK